MPTVIASRPDVSRHVILGLIQLGIAGGVTYLLLSSVPAPQAFQNAARWGISALLVVPLFVWGLRNAHRLFLRCEISADEHGLSARIPARGPWLAPWLRVLDWSAPWEEITSSRFLDGRRAALRLDGAGEPLILEGGEFAASLYEIDAAIRQAAPERVRERFPLPQAVRKYPSTPTRWIAVGGLVAVGVSVVLTTAVAPGRGEPPLLFGVPGILGICLLALASAGRRHGFVDQRGFFLVHGRHTAFLRAEAMVKTGEWKLATQFPGFRLLSVGADGEGGRILVKMNQILGLGIQLPSLETDLDRRVKKGFATPSLPPQRTSS